ncbi:Calx-beta domain-containing protein [Allosphingosinicella deserti]|uniref:Cadherin domain-containing protein n=1 Tax=Allosphingosinicella deserti TaxID=2116704 RepID=A0A2P7QF22_9SPHN|nr:cadherin domain-containing protein [Sphingomonas deserti]PSJ36534.1 hypothetical protein C7I55_26060 [Sphingomonas deserti]
MAGVWINEFHYDNAGGDTGEFIEIAAAAGTSLTGWSLVLYNGANGQSYNTRALTGTISGQQNGFGTLSFPYPADGIQNGAPDAIALVDPTGQVIEFLSYEGSFTAANGPAAGMTSVSVGASVIEPGNATGTSIGRVGTGDESGDFTWAVIADDTPGGVNAGQTFSGIVVDTPGAFSIADAAVVEGQSGTTPITFTVSRGSDSNVAASVDYAVTLAGGATGADASDFAAPVLSGSLAFAAGEFSKTITLQIAGDAVNEADEGFVVTLSNPGNGATIADGSATGTIINDDAVVSPGAPFVNEIHYDNAGTDTGEAIEIAAPSGTNLAGWSLILYSVSSGATTGTVYGTVALSGIVGDQDDGYGTLQFAVSGLQNGAQDGFALVNPAGQVVQFLSYEGAFVAANGAAAGLTSTDIGVAEDSGTGVGLSLQLTGAGASAADFSWTSAGPSSFGSVNEGQDFVGPDATGLVSVGDARVIEGDGGVQQLVFTVQRAGGLGQQASVDWVLNLGGSADTADLGAGQPLSGSVSFAPGVSSVQIAVAVAGDTIGEGNETFNLLLANPAGNIAISDASATGTIVNDDPIPLRIFEIQGEGHRSDYVGQPVTTGGIVTGVLANGFFVQDAAGDGNGRTSDALFVFTGGAPGVVAGDAIEVRGTVAENLPGGDATNLSATQVTATSVTVQSSGNALPASLLIGENGLRPPTEIIDDDGLTSYDPATDGIDFYESLEGMRVTIEAPLVVAPSSEFGETWVVASGGAGATGVNDRGGITISDGDYNPEKIQIDATSALFAGYEANHSQGDRLGDVTGIMSYGFASYEVLVTEAVTVTQDVTLAPEAPTELVGDRDHLTVASYNVENLDVGDGAAKFDLLADNIVYSLKAPDIVALQEIQDADGPGSGSDLSGQVTAQALIDAIKAAGGPDYVYVEVAPTTAGASGGEPGGNIRNGYLYNADRVSYVEGSALLLGDSAFNGTRKPLVGDFVFNGETVRLINVHFTSRGGSDPLWGSSQPPADAGDGARAAQGAAVASYVNSVLATDPSLKLGVMGDFNGFWFEDNVSQLEAGGVLTNLHRLLPEEERYSYFFEGNLQALDNFLVSGGLSSGAQFDAVHINAEQPDSARATDHDPTVGRFFIAHPNEAPVDLVLDDASVDENAPAGTLVGTLSAEDPDADVLAFTLVDDAGGRFAVDAATGRITTTAPLDHEAAATYTVVARATDGDGLFVERTLTLTVADVNDAPVAAADKVAVQEDGTSANLWSLLLGNDSDQDAGSALSISAVNSSGTLGSLVFDAASKTLRYVADDDSFDALAPGATVVDRFTYTVTDAGGLTSTATVEVTVTGVADGIIRNGGNGTDLLFGTGDEDRLSGGNGADLFYGYAGHDHLAGDNGNDALFGGDGDDWLDGGASEDALVGGDGNDVLIGGKSEDLLTGGKGDDLFVFGKSGSSDLVLDFDSAHDRLVLLDGIGVRSVRSTNLDFDGKADLVLTFSNGGGSVTLMDAGSYADVRFAPPEILGLHPAV